MKGKSKLYGYLDSIGVLQNGTPEMIRIAKRQYWNMYRREWKRSKRHVQSTFEIFFTKQEMKDLERSVKQHLGMSITSYIKHAALSDQSAVMNPRTIGAFHELLLLHFHMIIEMQETSLFPVQYLDRLVSQVEGLREQFYALINRKVI